MLPGMDGFRVLETLRGEGFEKPVLILTARSEEADKVRGFRLNADQYLTKPFGLLELLERVKALLRRKAPRAGGHDGDPDVIRFSDVVVDPAARTATRAGEPISLTPRAYDLLVCLARHEGKVVSRQDLLKLVWKHQAAIVTRTVDSHVSELRWSAIPQTPITSTQSGKWDTASNADVARGGEAYERIRPKGCVAGENPRN